MFSKVSERQFHVIRWILVLGWLLLIASLFYDPISAAWTVPNSGYWLSDSGILSAATPENCVQVQGNCLVQEPYPVANRVFWGMVVPSAILVVLLLGHETWRRICPLYFLSQIPRALGLQPRLNIHQNRWLQHNHLYLQFSYFFVGLNVRILFVNSSRIALGMWLLLTISLAITTVFLYGGRSWCHYVCPFGIVQLVFTGPRGLLDSQAHIAPARSITQSMCRTIDSATKQEQSVCIGCKSACLDIDAEKSYWQQLNQPGRRLVQYGYLGLVVGYIAYYWLYAGNSDYYFSGVWTHEPNQLGTLLKPGFFLAGQALNIPKFAAAPLTLGCFAGLGHAMGSYAELFVRQQLTKNTRRGNQKEQPEALAHLLKDQWDRQRAQVRHRIFTLCTFLAFNLFFIYGGRPELNRLPLTAQIAFQCLIACVSVLWLYRTWPRSETDYTQESLADKLRRQLEKLPLNFEHILGERRLKDLEPAELHILAQALPRAAQADRKAIYRGVLQESLTAGLTNTQTSLILLNQLRQELEISETEHHQLLGEWMQGSAAEAAWLGVAQDLPRTLIRQPSMGLEVTQIRQPRRDR